MTKPPIKLAILIPIYNDWESVQHLIDSIDEVLGSRNIDAQIFLVNDHSLFPILDFSHKKYQNLQRIQVINLRRNLGHQRSIVIGLYHIWKGINCENVLVMDGDGEDRPEEDVVSLAIFSKKTPYIFYFCGAYYSLRRDTVSSGVHFVYFTISYFNRR